MQSKRVTLTRLEGEVMRAVWDVAPDPVRVRDVLEALNGKRSKPLAYTTVQTVLTILKDKGVVKLVRGPGRANRYAARISREETSRHMLADLAQRLFGGHVTPVLQHLIDHGDLNAKDLAELREWVEAKLKDAES